MKLSRISRKIGASGAGIAVAVLTIGLCLGCEEVEAARLFRQTAASNLERGVGLIVDGLLDGAFAVLESGDDPTPSTGTTTTPTTTPDTTSETTEATSDGGGG